MNLRRHHMRLRFGLSAGIAPMLSCLVAPASGQAARPADTASQVRISSSVTSFGGFVPNEGQWATDASFVAVAEGLVVRADTGGFWLDQRVRADSESPLARAILRVSFESAGGDVQLRSERPLAGEWSYLYGRDPERWRTGLPSFGTLSWQDVRPGVSFSLARASDGHELSYSLECAPGSGERPLVMRLEGADELLLDPTGRLVARTSIGDLLQSPPRAWSVGDGGVRTEVEARFAVLADDRFAIDVPGRDDALALLIDPGITWAGYIGGSSTDTARDLALTASDESVTVGRTLSFDFPTTPGVFQETSPPGYDAFAMKVSADGASIVFATYVGGSLDDEGFGVALRASGAVVMVGKTRSPDFPTTAGAFDTTLDGSQDAFVLELRPEGTALTFSGLLGGSGGQDSAKAVALYADASIAVVGETDSANFPGAASGYQSAHGGGATDGFAARVSSNGSALISATYFGGLGADFVSGTTVAADDAVIVAGYCDSWSWKLATPGAFDTFPNGSTAGYVAKLAPSLSSLVFCSYVDGSAVELVFDVDLRSSGEVVVVGITESSDFPTTPGAFDTTLEGFGSGYVAALTSDGSSLAFASFTGTFGEDGTHAVDVDATDVITIGGECYFDPFPATPGAFDGAIGPPGTPDAYLMRFKPDGSGLLYATLMGGPPDHETTHRIAIDGQGRAIALGNVVSNTFPVTPGSFDSTYGGGTLGGYKEGFLAEIEMQPFGVRGFGSPTPACKGPIRLTALHVPTAGNTAFAIACVGAPPGAIGVLGVSGAAVPTGIPLLGALVYLDVTLPFVLVAAGADALGYDEVSLPIPSSAAGLRFYVQAAWLDTGGCGGGLTLSASDALRIDVPL